MRRIPAVAGAAALVLAAASWWLLWRPQSPQPTESKSPATAGQAVPVIIYLVDTLRADRLGPYGYGRNLTPHTDALAAESVVFERAYGAAPWTLPSVASLLTSTFACEHGIVRYRQKLNPRVKTLSERLTRLGYFTAAYYSNIHAGAVADLNRGYGIAEERQSSQNDRAADINAFLAQHGAGPFYLYLHTMEPHEPFATPTRFITPDGFVSVEDRETYRAFWFKFNELRSADWAARRPLGTTDNSTQQREVMRYLRDHRDQVTLLYDAAVRYADDNLGRAIAALKQNGVWDRAIFVFMADHGEEFGEHGGWFHDQSVYEELVHVPLIIHFPGDEYRGRRVAAPVSLVDVVPTLLDFLGRPELCDGCRGRSLLPAIGGGTVSGPDTRTPVTSLRINEVMFYAPFKQQRGDVNVAVRRGPWKGIWNEEPGSLELYDLVQDPAEADDWGPRKPELAASMRAEAQRWLAACRAGAAPPTGIEDLDERTRERLRAIGYLN